MLQKLSIGNYALIDTLEIAFSPGLNIITGETGAGKSILLGALSTILGQRADSGVLLNKHKKCIIEGTFDISRYALEDFFKDMELDFSRQSVVRREINAEGKSRSFINDTPVSLQTLKAFSSRLVDVHAQQETRYLADADFQLSLVDAYAGQLNLADKYRSGYRDLNKKTDYLNKLREQEGKIKSEQNFYQFQWEELEKAKLLSDDQNELEEELRMLSNAEAIKASFNKALTLLSESDYACLLQLGEVLRLIAGTSKFLPRAGELASRLQGVVIELKDIVSEMEGSLGDIVYDQQRIENLNERLNIIYQLEQKHRVKTKAELLAVKSELEQKLLAIGSLEEQISREEQELAGIQASLAALALKISDARKQAIPAMEGSVTGLLRNVGMPHAIFTIAMETADVTPPPAAHNLTLTASGIDKLKFLFSANRGIEAKDISKAASGGELSRLMLCVKASVAGYLAMPTLIFDEIDTGISGEIALCVAKLMEKVSENHQVIAITHLPQIASKGNAHLFVYKEVLNDATVVKIRRLNQEQRIKEIAKMIGGERVSEVSMENARQLMNS